VFQLLPHKGSARFLDEQLKPISLDLYNAETWKQYGWSLINNSDFRERYAREHSGAESLMTLDGYLVAVLQRANRFHEALNSVPAGEPPVTLFAIGGDCEETLDAPVLIRDTKNKRWTTLIRPRDYTTSTGRRIKKREATEAMYAPGDGRVTRRSLLGESLQDGSTAGRPMTLNSSVFGCELHSQLQRNKNLQDNALTILVVEALK
jgi:hypothetical protein